MTASPYTLESDLRELDQLIAAFCGDLEAHERGLILHRALAERHAMTRIRPVVPIGWRGLILSPEFFHVRS